MYRTLWQSRGPCKRSPNTCTISGPFQRGSATSPKRLAKMGLGAGRAMRTWTRLVDYLQACGAERAQKPSLSRPLDSAGQGGVRVQCLMGMLATRCRPSKLPFLSFLCARSLCTASVVRRSHAWGMIESLGACGTPASVRAVGLRRFTACRWVLFALGNSQKARPPMFVSSNVFVSLAISNLLIEI